ncbi:hypothetical protein [Glutamicibacter sp. MCAF14]|uniref:hypothetical protein n=1 Tax=Glutamicibacter sp. MCAF14 TaxID=3233043 RepID=UPI003F90FDBE
MHTKLLHTTLYLKSTATPTLPKLGNRWFERAAHALSPDSRAAFSPAQQRYRQSR